MIGVQATDTLTDSNGNTLASISGTGYVGGSASDLDSGGDDASVRAGGAHALSPHTSGTGSGHIPVQEKKLFYNSVDITSTDSGSQTPTVEAGQEVTVTTADRQRINLGANWLG